MSLIFWILLMPLQGEAEVTVPGEAAGVMFHPTNIASPYEACSDKMVEGRPVSPDGHKRANEEKEKFYSLLLAKIKEASLSNIKTTRDFQKCYSKPSSKRSKVSKSAGKSAGYCDVLRNWVDPKAKPLHPTETIADEHSLNYAVEQARTDVALSMGTGKHPDLFTLNKNLESGTSRMRQWKPLTRPEKEVAQKKLDEIFVRVYEKAGGNAIAKDWREFREMMKERVPLYATNRTDMVGKQYSNEARRILNEGVGRLKWLRENHYSRYLNSASALPIINFLPGPITKDSQISDAVTSILPIAKREFSSLSDYDADLATVRVHLSRRPKTQISFTNLRPLLDYRLIVEKLLKSEPGLCHVATLEAEGVDSGRSGRGVISTGPILASTILLGPVAGVVVSLATGGYYIADAVRKGRDCRQAANASIRDKSILRCSQQEVESLRGKLGEQILFTGLDLTAVGGATKALARIQKARPK